MKRFLRGSSSQGSKDKQAKEKEKSKYNLPRVAKVRPCEWPCDNFLRAAGIYEDIYSLAENAGLTDFLYDRIEQPLPRPSVGHVWSPRPDISSRA